MGDEEWALVASYLMSEDAPERAHSLREVFNGVFCYARLQQRLEWERGG